MLNMSTLFERLVEICRDAGIQRPRGVDIQAVTGLSSGRVTQIKNEREAARLGGDALQAVVRRGYSADWVQEGRPPKRSGTHLSQESTPFHESGSDAALAATQGGHESGTLLTLSPAEHALLDAARPLSDDDLALLEQIARRMAGDGSGPPMESREFLPPVPRLKKDKA